MNWVKNIKKVFKFIARNTNNYVDVICGKGWNWDTADDAKRANIYTLLVRIMHIFPLVWCLFSVVVTFVMRNGNLIATFKNEGAFIYWVAVYFPVVFLIELVLFIILLVLSSKWRWTIGKHAKQRVIVFSLIVFPIVSCVLLNFFASLVVLISLLMALAVLCVVLTLMNIWSRISLFIFGEPTIPTKDDLLDSQYDSYDSEITTSSGEIKDSTDDSRKKQEDGYRNNILKQIKKAEKDLEFFKGRLKVANDDNYDQYFKKRAKENVEAASRTLANKKRKLKDYDNRLFK